MGYVRRNSNAKEGAMKFEVRFFTEDAQDGPDGYTWAEMSGEFGDPTGDVTVTKIAGSGTGQYASPEGTLFTQDAFRRAIEGLFFYNPDE
jgi:hypothetical protein